MSTTGSAASPVIDLHAHSAHSDGTQSAADLVLAASCAGVDVLGLTDHDVVDGWDAAAAQAARVGITVVPGVELSTQVAGMSVHLLAYLVDPWDRTLGAMMGTIRAHRTARLRRTVELLAADGYPVDYDEIVAWAGAGTTLGRPHVADALVRAGSFPDRDAVFETLLHSSSPYYVRHWAPSTSEAIGTVRSAGGVPVLAHPFAHRRGRVLTEADIDDLVDVGLCGLEVHHPDHDAEAVATAGSISARRGLVQTGASDYHGTGKSNRLAQCTTAPETLERLLGMGSGSPLLGSRG
ncbi:MAG TPA: PHP domain-containing protein [Ornithinimicrobium sp.]|uniref:PHP domain-containing protein n=1 Tax=Ornithinimicrobium sp. TaxID=1977084 RepID=UPI002B466494|nr:PHP domain-containing protein [Ornithinimicrobium sp.]HKJ11835.1 PHP domain-containing protein [Ornithinimicrobium sp.]